MRTTVNIRDGLLHRLKLEAERSGVSLTDLVNRTLEVGLERICPPPVGVPYTCPVYSMGEPAFDVDKALRQATDLEDAETLRKLHLRK